MNTRFVPVIHGAAAGRPDEADTIAVAADIAQTLKLLGFSTEIVHLGLDLSGLERLAARRPYAVFNLVEALNGKDALSAIVPPVLEDLGLAFTGARTTAHQLAVSKVLTKERLRAANLPTADWWEDGRDIPPDTRVIIKSVTEHASAGLDSGSVVTGVNAGRELKAREARFGGRFFAEAFMTGREFNISVLEQDGKPLVLPIPEIEFVDWPADRPRIVDYEAKWDESSPAYHQTARVFGLEAKEGELAIKLQRLALACWRAFDLNGYARVDVRLDAGGAPFILEVNVNPCLAQDAGFVMTARQAGLSFDDVIMQIIESAQPRENVTARPLQNTSSTGEGWREAVNESDVLRIRDIVEATGYFTAEEIEIAAELVEERLNKGTTSGYNFILFERGTELLGYACYGLAPGTDASYDLYWIVVTPGLQGQGIGRRILARTEQRIAEAGGTIIYVDTSSTERYVPTRAFYEHTGFSRVAALDDFYRAGDSKVIYEKRLR